VAAGFCGLLPAVRHQRREREREQPGGPAGQDVLPAAGDPGQKVCARPDQLPGSGTDRPAQTDRAGKEHRPRPRPPEPVSFRRGRPGQAAQGSGAGESAGGAFEVGIDADGAHVVLVEQAAQHRLRITLARQHGVVGGQGGIPVGPGGRDLRAALQRLDGLVGAGGVGEIVDAFGDRPVDQAGALRCSAYSDCTRASPVSITPCTDLLGDLPPVASRRGMRAPLRPRL
jgi:hypothetical protein